MGKLHELLAVEGDLAGVSKKITDETVVTFEKKPDHFLGAVRKYEPLKEDEPDQPTEYKELVDTVFSKLIYTKNSVSKYWDAFLQKEATNQVAKADIIVDGEVLVKDVPATALLGFETKLKDFRRVLEAIPTLQPGVAWEKDETKDPSGNVFITKHPIEKNRTVKDFAHRVLVSATEHHPAQIEKWEELKVVGKYVTTNWSSCYSGSKKRNAWST
jgi:hypothetical protein